MKPLTAFLLLSLGANLVLAVLLSRSRPASPSAKTTTTPTPFASATPAVAPNSSTAPASAITGLPSRADSIALRDRLRALGFSAREVHAAVRASIEAPRRSRHRSFFAAAAAQPWWQPDTIPAGHPDADVLGLTPQQTRELRDLRRAERAELNAVLGEGADVTAADLEPYQFLPPDKSARAAAIARDHYEEVRALRLAPGPGGESASIEERQAALLAARNQALAAFLTPAELDDFELHTSFSARLVARDARHFPATADEYRILYENHLAQQALHEASSRDRFNSTNGRARIDASTKLALDLKATLGPARYAEWQASQRDDHRALVELQRRFPLPPATLEALRDIPRQISTEGRRIAEDRALSPDQQLTAVRDLADEGRARVRTLLGDDLGTAYNEASYRGWLEHLERGSVPFIDADGRFALFGVGRGGPQPPRINPRPAPQR